MRKKETYIFIGKKITLEAATVGNAKVVQKQLIFNCNGRQRKSSTKAANSQLTVLNKNSTSKSNQNLVDIGKPHLPQ